jgi:hypothetical protein
MKRTSWTLLAFLAIAIGVYFTIKYSNEKKAAEATPVPEANSYLIQETDSVLTRIRIFDQDYHIVEMQRNQDGFWDVTLPTVGAADQVLASEAETQFGALGIVTDVGQVASLSDFGLTFPAYTIKLTYANGVEHKIEVGNTTPTGSGYYVQLDDAGIYVISQYGLNAVLNLIDNPPYPATATPTPTLEMSTNTPEVLTPTP